MSEILHRLDAETVCEQNPLYMDITLAWFTALMGGKIAGILKTELMLIRALYRKYPSIKFFALHEAWGYQPIDVSALAELVTGTDLDKDFDRCRAALSRIRSIPAWNESDPAQSAAAQKALDGLKCKTDAYWFLVSLFPKPRQQRMIDYGKKKKAKLQAETLDVTVPGKAVKQGHKRRKTCTRSPSSRETWSLLPGPPPGKGPIESCCAPARRSAISTVRSSMTIPPSFCPRSIKKRRARCTARSWSSTVRWRT